MKIDRLDLLVMTVKNVATTFDFYSHVLGMQVVTFGEKSTSQIILKRSHEQNR